MVGGGKGSAASGLVAAGSAFGSDGAGRGMADGVDGAGGAGRGGTDVASGAGCAGAEGVGGVGTQMEYRAYVATPNLLPPSRGFCVSTRRRRWTATWAG